MELRQLRYFIGIVVAGSFGRAADRLHIAQPALSRQIKALEDELGVQLLFRTAQGVQVTEAGQKLRELAEYLLRSVEDIKTQVTHLASEPAGNVVVGLPPSLAYLVTPQLIATCQARYPMLTIRILEALSVFLVDWLELGRLDVAILTDPRESHAIQRQELADEDMVLVGTPDKFDQGATTVTLSELAGYSIVISQGFERVLHPWCEAANIEIRYAMELDSIHVIKQMVRRGVCTTVVPYGMVHDEVSQGILKALPFRDPPITRRIVLAYSSRRPVSLSMTAVGELLISEIELIRKRCG